MFEERFGRFATTVLLVALGLGVFSYCTKLSVESTIYFYGLVTSASWVVRLHEVITAGLILLFQGAAAFFLVWAIWRFYFLPRTDKIRNEINQLLDDTQKKAIEVVNKAETESNRLMDRAEVATDKTEKLIGEAKKILSKKRTKSPLKPLRPTQGPRDKPKRRSRGKSRA